jgi:hypothetical protein
MNTLRDVAQEREIGELEKRIQADEIYLKLYQEKADETNKKLEAVGR